MGKCEDEEVGGEEGLKGGRWKGVVGGWWVVKGGRNQAKERQSLFSLILQKKRYD